MSIDISAVVMNTKVENVAEQQATVIDIIVIDVTDGQRSEGQSCAGIPVLSHMPYKRRVGWSRKQQLTEVYHVVKHVSTDKPKEHL